MPDAQVKVDILADDSDLAAKMRDAAGVTKKTASDMGASGSKMAEDAGKSSNVIGGHFDSLKGRVSSLGGAAKAGLSGDFKGAISGVEDAAKGIPGVGVAIAAGVGIGGAAIAGFASSSISKFKDIATAANSLSRVSGLTVEDASRWNFAASQVGIGSDRVVKSLRVFEKGAITNGKAIGELGVSMNDASGKARPMNDVLLDVADKFKDMPNGPQKTALALQLFGRAGTDMIPLLNKGAAGIEEMQKKSDKFGLTVGAKNVEDMKKYNAANRDMTAAVDGLKVQFGEHLMPILATVASFLAEHLPGAIAWCKNVFEDFRNGVTIVANDVSAIWQWVQKNFGDVVSAIQGILGSWITGLQGLWNFITDIFQGKWGKLWGDVLQIFSGIWGGIKGSFAAVWGYFKDVIEGVGPALLGLITGAFLGILHFVEGLPGQFVDAASAVGKAIWNGIVSGLSGAASFVGDIATKLWNGVKGFVNRDFIDPIKRFKISVPLVGSFQPFGGLPELAAGGTMQRGGLALVGEKGPELAYLPGGSHVYPTGVNPVLGSGNGSGGGDSYGPFIFQGPANKADVTQWVLDAIAHGKRTGMTKLDAA